MVNGYTDPDNESLQRMMHRHGGALEKYETTRVTHIVAEQLSTAKANIYKRQKRPIPVVRPAWVVACVEAQRLLPIGEYLLETVREDGVQRLPFVVSKRKTNKNETKHESAVRRTLTHSSSTRSKRNGIGEKKKSHMAIVSSSQSSSSSSLQSRSESPKTSPMQEADPSEPVLLQIQDLPSSNLTPPIPTTIIPTTTVPPRRLAFQDPMDDTSRGELDQDQGSVDDDHSDDHSDDIPLPVQEYCSPTDEPIDMNDTEAKAAPPAVESVQPVVVAAPTNPATAVPTKELQHTAKGATNSTHIDGKIRTVGTDPNFLESYFKTSRLSYIGSFKQRSKPQFHNNARNDSAQDRRQQQSERFVFHIDMDCFFASVVLRNHPHLRDKPVAISHCATGTSGGPTGHVSKTSTSECATCNYAARAFGIKKGMFLGRAKELCPDLVLLKYDFEGYEEVSDQVSSILFAVATQYGGSVEQVSCDESYLELRLSFDEQDNHDQCENEGTEPTTTTSAAAAAGEAKRIAESIRTEIEAQTKCTATIGVAPNKLLAKLTTSSVKPNGCRVLLDYKSVLQDLRLRDLHGIGYRGDAKLRTEGLLAVKDVWALGNQAKGILCNILGPRLGEKILAACQGQDDRPVQPAARKTIGAEVSDVYKSVDENTNCLVGSLFGRNSNFGTLVLTLRYSLGPFFLWPLVVCPHSATMGSDSMARTDLTIC